MVVGAGPVDGEATVVVGEGGELGIGLQIFVVSRCEGGEERERDGWHKRTFRRDSTTLAEEMG